MIDFTGVTQLTINGQAVINLFLNGTKIWEKNGGAQLSDYLFRRWTFDTVYDDVADVPLTLYGNAQLSDGQLIVNGNGYMHMNYAQLSGNNWPVSEAEGGATLEMWVTPYQHRNWARLFDFGHAYETNETGYGKWGNRPDYMCFEIQGDPYGGIGNQIESPVLNLNVLQHVVIVYDLSSHAPSTEVSVFQFQPGGTYTVNSKTISVDLSAFWNTSDNCYLGQSGNQAWADYDYTGSYSDFRVWSKPLTLDEIVSCDTLGPDELPWKTEPDPLTFKSSEPLTVGLGYSGSYGDAPVLNLEYDVDGSDEWTPFGYSDSITAQGGQEIRIRASSPNVGGTADDDGYNCFQLTGEGVSAYGDLRSLLNKNKFANGRFDFLFNNLSALKDASDLVLPNKSAYKQAKGLFLQCGSLEKAPDLPATTLCAECYRQMFYGCSSLTAAPSITADTIGESGCRDMFGQSGILSAGTICATTLGVDACRGMFWHCDSLTAAPEIRATTLSTGSCWGMFLQCGSLQTPPPVLAATSAAPSCYAQMFDRCTSLTAAPALCATVPAGDAYKQMFLSCYSLTSVPDLNLTGTASGTFCQMFEGCSSITDVSQITLPEENSAAQWAYYAMFSKCYSLVSGPHIRAKDGGKSAFAYMFDGCSALTSIQVDFTSWPTASNANQLWVRGVYSTGTFTCPTSLGTDSTIKKDNYKCPYQFTVTNSDS